MNALLIAAVIVILAIGGRECASVISRDHKNNLVIKDSVHINISAPTPNKSVTSSSNVATKLADYGSVTTESVITIPSMDNSGSTGRQGLAQRRKKHKKPDLMSKILPMMVMPFLVSSSMIPMMLTSLKFMLLKSLFVGKIAIILVAINALWRSNNHGGVYSHNINVKDSGQEQKDLNMMHYGYNGGMEYGAIVNKRSTKHYFS